MPSTRKQKTKSGKSREIDILCEYGSMDIMLGERNTNPVERELESIIIGPGGQPNTQSLSNRKNSSQENEMRTFDNRNRQLGNRDFQCLSTYCLTK